MIITTPLIKIIIATTTTIKRNKNNNHNNYLWIDHQGPSSSTEHDDAIVH